MNNYRKLEWTQHSQIKMRQYGLSKQKLLNILSRPERKEQGIVPCTTAVMRTNKKFGNKNPALFKNKTMARPPKRPKGYSTFRQIQAPGEIWIMYKDVKKDSLPVRKIISAWRYPGISKPGELIPIPEDIMREILNSKP